MQSSRHLLPAVPFHRAARGGRVLGGRDRFSDGQRGIRQERRAVVAPRSKKSSSLPPREGGGTSAKHHNPRNRLDGRGLVRPDPKRERARPGYAAPFPLVWERLNLSLRVPLVRKPAELAARSARRRVDGEVGGFGPFLFLARLILGIGSAVSNRILATARRLDRGRRWTAAAAAPMATF
jgi:hypothetical protein